MANTTTSGVISDLLAKADARAAEYEVAYADMLAKRKATRDAAAMAQDLAKVLDLPAPELSEAVTKVLAKRKSRGGDDSDDE